MTDGETRAGQQEQGGADEQGGAGEWTRTRLFMRRPTLDGLTALPALPEGYALRRYRTEDCAALAALLTGAFDEVWDEARVRRDLSETPDVEQIYVVAYRETPVATASARLLPAEYPGSGYLHWVGADPAHRGKGLGSAVSLRVLHHFRDAGLRDAVLETNDFRYPAVLTYLRLGFIPEYHYGDPDEQLRWSRLLPQLVK